MAWLVLILSLCLTYKVDWSYGYLGSTFHIGDGNGCQSVKLSLCTHFSPLFGWQCEKCLVHNNAFEFGPNTPQLLFTLLQSTMNAKLGQLRFCPSHDDGHIKRTQTQPKAVVYFLSYDFGKKTMDNPSYIVKRISLEAHTA